MALSVQRGSGDRPALSRAREWEPFRTFRDLLRWDPFAELSPSFSSEMEAFLPDFEVKENPDSFVIKADVPGVKEADIDIRITQNRLTVSGKREHEKSEKNETYYMRERSFGNFVRTFTLPEGIDADQIKADLKEGVLSINLPKKPESQPKKISVKSG